MEEIKKIPQEKLTELKTLLDKIFKDKTDYDIIDNVLYPAILSKTALRKSTIKKIENLFKDYSIAATTKNSSYYRKGFHLIVYVFFN